MWIRVSSVGLRGALTVSRASQNQLVSHRVAEPRGCWAGATQFSSCRSYGDVRGRLGEAVGEARASLSISPEACEVSGP